MTTKREQTAQLIASLSLNKQNLSRIAAVAPSRVSQYIRGRQVSDATSRKIEQTVADIIVVWGHLGCKPDLADADGFRKALATAREQEPGSGSHATGLVFRFAWPVPLNDAEAILAAIAELNADSVQVLTM